MTLQRLNNYLTKGMIGILISLIPLLILTVVSSTIFGYVFGIMLCILMFVTAVNFITATILLAIDFNKLIDAFIKQYESEKGI